MERINRTDMQRLEAEWTPSQKGQGDAALKKQGRGRPPAIPERLFETVFRAYAQGSGYRSIANRLTALGVPVEKSSVARLIRGQGCYRGRRVSTGQPGGR